MQRKTSKKSAKENYTSAYYQNIENKNIFKDFIRSHKEK